MSTNDKIITSVAVQAGPDSLPPTLLSPDLDVHQKEFLDNTSMSTMVADLPAEKTEDGTIINPALPEPPKADDEPEYPGPKSLALILLAIYMAVLVVALDRNIIATALPKITDSFGKIDDLSWYASAFMITGCAFQLIFGRFYTFYSSKMVFLEAISIFEVGSIICGAAPNSTTFILGRAIAGLGTAGIFGGAIVLLTNAVPLHKRPLYTGMVGGVFGIASVAGPLLGGVFTDKVSWRWCFYINVPFGAITMLIIQFVIKGGDKPRNANLSLYEQFRRLDPIGSLLFLPSIVCLLLALQWGGSVYAWGNYRVVICLVFFGILIIAFIAVQFWQGEYATVPIRIIKQRSIACGVTFTFLNGGSMITLSYFIPIWFQAIKGTSAIRSGIDSLPLILSLVVMVITSGIFVKKTGYYTPLMIFGSILMPIGAGLITTFDIHTPPSKWIGYQIIYGLGLGMSMQQANMAAQTVLARFDVPTGISLGMFGQTMGGAVMVSVGQNVFQSYLVKRVSTIANIPAAAVVSVGATELRNRVPPQVLPAVLEAYNEALRKAFYVALVVTCLNILPALGMEWRSVKGPQGPLPKDGAKQNGSGTNSIAGKEKEADLEAGKGQQVVQERQAS